MHMLLTFCEQVEKK